MPFGLAEKNKKIGDEFKNAKTATKWHLSFHYHFGSDVLWKQHFQLNAKDADME